MPAIPTIPILHTDDGGSVRLGRLLGSGGEAGIHEVIGRADLVAKIYHEDDPAGQPRLLAEKEAKIAAMLARPPEISGKNSTIAWPLTALRRGPRFVGFLMPRVQGSILFRYHNPKERRKHSPNFDWFYLHRAAHNLSAIVDAIHRAGHVIADMNDQNFLVQDSALVAAVDTDSFQIKDREEHWHLCTVGRPEFTPPELQGKSFAAHPRGPEQDSFGLAVMIFQLLMEGSHPFRARLSLPHSVPEAQLYCIQHGHFPYAPAPGNPASPPPTGLDFKILDPLLQNLFLRCFVDGHAAPSRRPSAADWREGLRQAEAALITCTKGHHHRAGLPGCPWCARGRRIEELRQARPPIRRGVLPTVLRPGATRPPVWTAKPRVMPAPTRPARRAYVTSPAPDSKAWTSIIWIAAVILFRIASCDHHDEYPYHPKSSPSPVPSSSSRLNNYPLPAPKPKATIKRAHTLEHPSIVQHAELSSDDKHVVSVDENGQARIWDVESETVTQRIPQSGVSVAHFSSDGLLVVTAGSDQKAQVWRVGSAEPVGAALDGGAPISDAIFSPDVRFVFTAAGNRAQVWDRQSGKRVGAPLVHEGAITAIAFSPDGHLVATASLDRKAKVWDAATGECWFTTNNNKKAIYAVAFHPQEPLIVTACENAAAVVTDYETGAERYIFSHGGEVCSAAFSPDGRSVLTASSTGNPYVWEMRTRSVTNGPAQLPGWTTARYGLNGGMVITTSSEGTGRVWDPDTGVEIGVLSHGNGVPVTSSGFGGSGRYLFSAGGKSVKIWLLVPTASR